MVLQFVTEVDLRRLTSRNSHRIGLQVRDERVPASLPLCRVSVRARGSVCVRGACRRADQMMLTCGGTGVTHAGARAHTHTH